MRSFYSLKVEIDMHRAIKHTSVPAASLSSKHVPSLCSNNATLHFAKDKRDKFFNLVVYQLVPSFCFYGLPAAR